MFPNWSGWKTVQGALFAASALVALVPTQYQTLYSTVLGSVGAVVVVLSGTSVGPALVQK